MLLARMTGGKPEVSSACGPNSFMFLMIALGVLTHLGNPRPDNLRIVEEVFDVMIMIAKGLGIDPNHEGLIPWDAWYLRRELSLAARAEDRTASEVQASEDARASQMDVYSAVMGLWGAPGGPEHAATVTEKHLSVGCAIRKPSNGERRASTKAQAPYGIDAGLLCR